MTREDFYHSKPMTFLQRLVSIGYGTCGCCGMPWNFASKHGGEHTIMVNKYNGFFPVCEYCWTHKSYEQNKSAVTKLIKKWRECGGRPINSNTYKNAFENDWIQTHNKNNIEEKITALIARDKDGTLLVLDHPTSLGKGKFSWFTDDDVLFDKDNVRAILHRSYLPQIKWEDEKPTEIELTIKIK